MGCKWCKSTKITSHRNTIIFSQLPTYNLETFTLIWLDTNVNRSDENLKSQIQLRSIINYLQVFDDMETCKQYVQERESENIVLIVLGSLAKTIVPEIHSLQQLHSIYIYCREQTMHQELMENYSKV